MADLPEGTGSHGIEETSPDMLKNTPSNIMRLADEIQQCEGRQKYLAQTRSPSDGGDVRWYFCKVSLAENAIRRSLSKSYHVPEGIAYHVPVPDPRTASIRDPELAASVPRTEIVGKGDYFRFGMRDSLAIEESFLQVCYGQVI
ncbi:phospholipase SGR2-like isoform X2 [Actinidia eriantha]|uniref:phospholipase SGR2-like isoform X2 n=1 Tax=Actinidia eriantha TaxID=165200 RepID=UPI00258BE753|nr:phospholipase SGR2-like isoform X2 [Actinidia eriantha]